MGSKDAARYCRRALLHLVGRGVALGLLLLVDGQDQIVHVALD